MRRTLALLAITSVLLLSTGLPAASAQNQTPNQGGPSNSAGVNSGTDDSSGNRSTPGGAGATGGGAETGKKSNGGGKGVIAFLVALALGCVVVFAVLTRRNRRADEQLEGSGRS